ncbi:pseudouridine kinase-like [Anopheles marshallii]|uniref:pseudouridine kinase-like n=1 Tax=Anopheles marshallii TaxID=1521116 RepID=UPI00237A5461|nr:pseudouridine kinase-like [Anopheles marshallii]
MIQPFSCSFVKALDGATYHAKQDTSAGGVARNIAEGIYKIYGNVNLISAVGNDQVSSGVSRLLPEHCASSIVTLGNCPTASFTVLLDRTGDCRVVVGDMEAHQAITPDWIKSHTNLIQQSPMTVIDANISEAAMITVFEECIRYNRPATRIDLRTDGYTDSYAYKHTYFYLYGVVFNLTYNYELQLY